MKKRIGLIIPSSNIVMETDFQEHIFSDYSLHVSRMYLEETTVEGEEKMLDDYFPQALIDISTIKPDAVVFGCTSAGALRGKKYEKYICDEIEKVSDAKSISVMNSVSDLLKNIEPKNLAVLTPYIDKLNERIEQSLMIDNINVTKIAGMGISDNFKISTISTKEIIDFAKDQLKNIEFDAVFFSCTNFQGWSAIKELKNYFSVPVISSNSAAFLKVNNKLGENVKFDDVL